MVGAIDEGAGARVDDDGLGGVSLSIDILDWFPV
jgi:hypothetical protein